MYLNMLGKSYFFYFWIVGKTAFALHLARTAASAGYHIAVYIFTYTIFFLMNN